MASRIKVRLPDESIILIDVDISDSVFDVKEKIESEGNISMDQYVLVFMGKCLDDRKFIASYGVMDRGYEGLTPVCVVTQSDYEAMNHDKPLNTLIYVETNYGRTYNNGSNTNKTETTCTCEIS